MNTFYRKVLQVALVSRNGGSIFPEGWLSLTGTVAHFDPEYSSKGKWETIYPF